MLTANQTDYDQIYGVGDNDVDNKCSVSRQFNWTGHATMSVKMHRLWKQPRQPPRGCLKRSYGPAYTDTSSYTTTRFSRLSFHYGVVCSMRGGAVLLKHKKICSRQPANVWQCLLSKKVTATVDLCPFHMTPNLSNLIIINPVLVKNSEHPRLTW